MYNTVMKNIPFLCRRFFKTRFRVPTRVLEDAGAHASQTEEDSVR